MSVVRQLQPNACVVDIATITELFRAPKTNDCMYPRVSRLHRGEQTVYRRTSYNHLTLRSAFLGKLVGTKGRKIYGNPPPEINSAPDHLSLLSCASNNSPPSPSTHNNEPTTSKAPASKFEIARHTYLVRYIPQFRLLCTGVWRFSQYWYQVMSCRFSIDLSGYTLL